MTTLDQRLVADGGVFAEVDPNSRLAATSATNATATGLANNETAYRSYDAGASHYQKNFAVTGSFNVSSGSLGGRFVTGWSTTLGHWDGNAEALGFDVIVGTGLTVFAVQVRERSGSSNYNATSTGNIFSVGAEHYYTFGRYSALGAKGGIYAALYSDAGLTTFLGFGFKEITHTDNNYRYYYDIQSYNFADANTITGSHSSITESAPTVGTDLTPNGTTVVETDPASKLVCNANCITFTSLNINSSAAHEAVDFGTDYFTDYKIAGVLNLTTLTSYSNNVGFMNILNVTNAAADGNAATVMQGVLCAFTASSNLFRLYIQENVGGTPSYSAEFSTTLSTNRPVSIVLARTGDTLTCKLWNEIELDANQNGTSQVGDTLTWTGRATTAYRHLMPIATHLSGSTSRSATGTIGGIRVIVTAAPSSYSITSSGGAVAGGSSTVKIGQKVLASGGIVSGGSSTILLGQKILSTGGGVLGGEATQYGTYFGTSTYSITSSGGMVAGGSSTINIGLKLSSSGGMVAGGSATISVAYAPGLSEYVYTEPVVDSTGTPVTGAGSKTSIFLKNVETGDIMDWSDVTMKSSGWVSITDVLSEAIYPAGEYGYTVPLSGLANGRYCATLKYTPTTPSSTDPIQTFQVEFFVIGGYVVDQYVSGKVDMAISAVAAATLAAATTTPIAANMEQTNGINLKGDGTSGDKFRSILVS